jgi:hypothetical protein
MYTVTSIFTLVANVERDISRSPAYRSVTLSVTSGVCGSNGACSAALCTLPPLQVEQRSVVSSHQRDQQAGQRVLHTGSNGLSYSSVCEGLWRGAGSRAGQVRVCGRRPRRGGVNWEVCGWELATGG